MHYEGDILKGVTTRPRFASQRRRQEVLTPSYSNGEAKSRPRLKLREVNWLTAIIAFADVANIGNRAVLLVRGSIAGTNGYDFTGVTIGSSSLGNSARRIFLSAR